MEQLRLAPVIAPPARRDGSGPGVHADDIPERSVHLAAACGQTRQGISWWRAVATNQWALRAGQEPGQPAPDVEQIMQLVQSAQRCEDGWRQWFASTGIQPCQVVYEDLARDRLAAANAALEFLRLQQLDADDLPPIRYRKQADTLTERYADLVRSAMSSRSTRDP